VFETAQMCATPDCHESADREFAMRFANVGLTLRAAMADRLIFSNTIEPMLNLGTPEWEMWDDGWTVVTADGSRAAHWEHTVAVRDEGLWVLTAVDGGAARLAALGARFAPLSSS
jgi:hypothetical protein